MEYLLKFQDAARMVTLGKIIFFKLELIGCALIAVVAAVKMEYYNCYVNQFFCMHYFTNILSLVFNYYNYLSLNNLQCETTF